MSGILLIAENKKARFDYHILETFEAGLVLVGSEVKSIRDKAVQLKDSYVIMKNGEAYLQKAHIAEFKMSARQNHEPERLRKLLLNRSEIIKIDTALTQGGLTCVALKIYFKDGRAKLEIGIAKGKKAHDKREAIKKKEIAADLRRAKQHDR